MILLADVVSVDDVRAAHEEIFEDMGTEYLRSGPFGGAATSATQRRIRNVPGRKIRRNLEALPAFERGSMRGAWAHNLAIWAGTHVWPDANHRTGITVFSLATSRTLDCYVVLPPDDVAALVRESKALRDPADLERTRYFTADELSDPTHPYRALFASYADRLETVSAADMTA